MAEFTFTAELWRWPGRDAWHFVALPEDRADDIRATVPPRGFGSVRVEATLGSSTWQTSVFPDTARHTYLLPVKQAVRRAEDVGDGDQVTLTVRLLEP